MPINLNHLTLVHAIATERSVSRAAEKLLISQPAVSKQLRELERSAGGPLFERLPRGVRPTQAGALLADYAGRILSLAAEAEERLAELRGLERGELRVGSSTTIAVYLLPPVLVAFQKAFPGVRLTVDVVNASDVANLLTDARIDVALSEGNPDPTAFVSTPFMNDPLIAIVGAGHSLAAKATVSAEQLCKHPFIVREAGSGTRDVVEQALAERGLSITPAMAVGSTIIIKRAVAAGAGVALVSRLACELELQSGTLIELKVPDLKITRPLYRVRVPGRHEGRAVVEFDKLLASAVRAFQKRKRPHRGNDHTAASILSI